MICAFSFHLSPLDSQETMRMGLPSDEKVYRFGILKSPKKSAICIIENCLNGSKPRMLSFEVGW